MKRLHRSSFLLWPGFLLALTLLGVSSASPPGSGPRPRLFHRVEPAHQGPAHHGSLAEARVEVNFSALERGRALDIELLDGRRVTALRTALERRSPDDYTWRGRLLGSGEKGGDVVLTVRNGAAAGSIYTAAGLYRLLPAPGREHRLALANPRELRSCGGALSPPEDARLGLTTNAQEAFTDWPGRLDILIVYTAKARSAAGGTAAIEAEMQHAIDLAHTAYANSQIVPRLNLVHMQEIGYHESKQFSTDLQWVRDDPEVNALRDQYGADMVALIIHNLSSCGVGYLMSQPSVSFAPNAYQVTAWDCAGDHLTLPHEFGHNQGADHNPEDASSYPNGAAYRWSYGHYIDGDYRTVMSYPYPCTVPCTRHPYFSNPNIIFHGQPTGVAGDRENYRTLNDTAIYVASFRPTSTPCGNGVIDGTEECDGDDFGGATCAGLGYSQGSLSCTFECTVDSSDCHTCGNGQTEGGEICDGADLGGLTCADFGCTGPGNLSCAATCDDFDLSTCSGCPVCDDDGVCDPDEDCSFCADCIIGSAPACGDGVCNVDSGEDCLSCAADCNGVQSGKTSNRFCCGNGGQNPVDCSDARCGSGGFSCTMQSVGPTCCGDLVCEGTESSCNCASDCGSPAGFETSCSNGADDDCDALVDCEDTADCDGDPACQVCEPLGAPCSWASECCSGLCKGKKLKFCS